MAFERAEVVDDDAERQRLLTFVIVGAGATGVEMAGAFAEVAQRTLRHDFRHIDPRRSRIILIEGGPRVLPAFPETLSDYAARSLRSMGVEVELDHMVTSCDARGVTLKDGRHIDAATVPAISTKAQFTYGVHAGARPKEAPEYIGARARFASMMAWVASVVCVMWQTTCGVVILSVKNENGCGGSSPSCT